MTTDTASFRIRRPEDADVAFNRRLPTGVRALVAIQQAGNGGSGSFLVRADDGQRYWCKVVNNPQHPRVPTNEEIVARLGRLAGVEVCDPKLIWIPADLVGWEFVSGRFLEEGWAHGSRATPHPVVETRTLSHRGSDDNRKRHAGFFALFDWLAGQDPQWLYADGADFAYWSHDHGHYLPGGPAWTVSTIHANRDTAYPLAADPTSLDPAELNRLAETLERLTGGEIADALADIPGDWPVSDDELEAIVAFADHRRPAVARRLRHLAH